MPLEKIKKKNAESDDCMNGILRRTAGDALHDYDGHFRISLYPTRITHVSLYVTTPHLTFFPLTFAPSLGRARRLCIGDADHATRAT
jgi:hypothetical protein